MLKSFRLQLTAWYLLFFALLLLGFSGFLYALLSRNLYARLDASLSSAAATADQLFRAELIEAHGDAPAAATETVGELRFPHTTLAILRGEQLLAATDTRWDARRLAALPRTPSTLGGFRTLLLADGEYRVAAVESLDSVESQLASLRDVFLLALPAAMLFAGLGGFLLAHKSLAPVLAMSRQAESISASNLQQRLDVGKAHQELGRLARVFNDLLARLEQSFESMRQFMADASHELRTPLSVIRGEADVALARDRDPAEYRESLTIIQDEARRLTRLVDDLLSLARAEAGRQPLHLEEFYLNDLVEDCCRSVQRMARQKGVALTCSCAGDLSFRGDQELLRRMVLNLLDNAIRYTPAGGRVQAILDRDGEQARMVVRDTGVGIPPEACAHVFERFYRVDKSRSRAEGGFGLGLSIVKWIAELHHGTVLLSSQSGVGSTFTVVLPLAGHPSPASPATFIVHSSSVS